MTPEAREASNLKSTYVFLHHFPTEGFYKLTTSTQSAASYNSGWEDTVNCVWETLFSSRDEADAFKWFALKGQHKFKPTREPKIKSSQTTYKGEPLDLSELLNKFERPADVPTWVYLAKLPEGTYKVGFTGTNPTNGPLKNYLVWVSKASSRARAESMSNYIYSECGENYQAAPEGYNFRQVFTPKRDISVFKDIVPLWAEWLNSKPKPEEKPQVEPNTIVVEEF